ncbi:hypothetical protein Tco_0754665 [Tanacetum coccineum]
MTATSTPSVILLSNELMTANNLTSLVLVKLDIDEMNYSSWVYFFKNLCKGFELLKHVLGEPTDEATSSKPSPPTPEWLKIDSIALSWIFMTLSKTLLVVEDPQTAKEAWDLIPEILNDNKCTLSISLKANYVLWSLNLKTVCSMLTTEGMRLKSRAQATSIDSTSSSPMKLLANLIIMEYLVKISKKAHILELKRRHLKGVSVPALHKKPQRFKDQYTVSKRTLYAVFNLK